MRAKIRDHHPRVAVPVVATDQDDEGVLDHRLRDGPVPQQQEGEPDHREPLRRVQAVEVGRQGGPRSHGRPPATGGAARAARSGVHRRIRIRSVTRIDDGHRTGGAPVRPGADEHPGPAGHDVVRHQGARLGAAALCRRDDEVCDVAHHRHGVGDGVRGRGEPGRVKAIRCDVPGEVSMASGPTPQPTPSWTSVPVLTGKASW